jgi:predicted NUDIX family NTP pyrophosphohydrolase
MPETSCGVLLFRRDADAVRVLITHPGGPYWRNQDYGAWTIPKGAPEPGESPQQTALREFEEELGTPIAGQMHPLGRIRQKGGKWVEAFAIEGDFDADDVRSNVFECEWPPRSGKIRQYPEIDRAAWLTLEDARKRLLPAQCEFLDRLALLLEGRSVVVG